MREQRWGLAKRHPRGVLGEEGSALVEFALVLIVTLTFIFGILDFSRFLYTDHFLSEAAREGARWAVVRGSTWSASCSAPWATSFSCLAKNTDVQSYVQSLTPPGINASSVTVTTTWPGTAPTGAATACNPSNSGKNPGCLVQVQVSYTYTFLFPFLPRSTWNLASTSEMVILQ